MMTEETPDSCDRCGVADGRRIFVGHTAEHGYDGLCATCLTTLTSGGTAMEITPEQEAERVAAEEFAGHPVEIIRADEAVVGDRLVLRDVDTKESAIYMVTSRRHDAVGHALCLDNAGFVAIREDRSVLRLSTEERDYRVTWEMEIPATSPLDAARTALRIHRDPESIATSFEVDGDRVDLEELGDGTEDEAWTFEGGVDAAVTGRHTFGWIDAEYGDGETDPLKRLGVKLEAGENGALYVVITGDSSVNVRVVDERN